MTDVSLLGYALMALVLYLAWDGYFHDNWWP